MSADGGVSDGRSEVTLESVDERLTQLTDLFRRRLLEDRGAQASIRELQERNAALEAELSGRNLKPFLSAIGLLAERIDSEVLHRGGEAFLESVRDELNAAIESLDVVVVDTPGDFDSVRHEVIAASGEGPRRIVTRVIRPGFERNGIPLLPARVEVLRMPEQTGDGIGTD
ncbi:hypothetical protein C6V83_16740 [Gordonia iterans]|uniref:Nucleotide exchange factor GrpE n=1 Tax=Gordonia iterans TaxID=1004901 RepID=A0A2S0KJ05_9ACTN|nr:hypothetical protein [Gordonia iterans]AVM01660.1 hypothetical protein C6V83_16740 [Gordonia iterans]